MSDKLLLFSALLLSVCVTVQAGVPTCSPLGAPPSESSTVINTPVIDSAGYGNMFVPAFSLSGCPVVLTSTITPPDTENVALIDPFSSINLDGLRLSAVQVVVNITFNTSGSLDLFVAQSSDNSVDYSDFSQYTEVQTGLQTGVVVTIPLTEDEYALGFRHTGEDVVIHRIQVYYSSCLVRFTSGIDEIPFGSTSDLMCVENSVDSNPLGVMCSATGVLNPLEPCSCQAGFNGTSRIDCIACPTGTFKADTGDGDCTTCPSFSEATQEGRTSCTCSEGHVRPDGSDITAACDQCVVNYYRLETPTPSRQCEMCPAGSSSNGGTESTCTCDEGLATATEATTTINADCDRCRAGYYRNSTNHCVLCPQFSSRAFGDPEAQCTCDEGRVTSSSQSITMGEDCNMCASTHFSQAGGCTMCPDGSAQSQDSDSTCTCMEPRTTAAGDTMTTTAVCSGCQSTYYLDNQNCVKCPNGSSTESPLSTTCVCDPGLSRVNGDEESTTEECVVVLGFIMESLTLAEGSSMNVTMQAGALSGVDVQFTSSSSVLSGILNSNPPFSSTRDATVTITAVGNNAAFDSYDPITFSIQPSASYIAGGIFSRDSAITTVYANLTVTITEDDDVTVGFVEGGRVRFNETQGMGAVTVRRTGGISQPLVLNITQSVDNIIDIESTVVTFPAVSQEQDDMEVPFSIIDDNTGLNMIRDTRLNLVLVSPQEFSDDVTLESIVVEILNDEPTPTSAPLTLEAIIGIAVGAAAVLLLTLLIVILIACICRLHSINRQGFYATYEDQAKEPPTMLRYSASLRSISSQTVVPVENTQGNVTKENEFYV